MNYADQLVPTGFGNVAAGSDGEVKQFLSKLQPGGLFRQLS